MEAASPLSELLAPQVGAIFQDAVDQLAVLGALAPPEEGGSSRGDSGGVLGDEVGSIVQEQRELERKYDALLGEREALRDSNRPGLLEENDAALREIAAQLKASTVLLCKSLQRKPGTAANIMKVQGERKFAQELLDTTTQEIVYEGTFSALTETLRLEHNKRSAVADTVARERQSRQEIKRLRGEIQRVLLEKEHEINEKNELVAQLKDHRQETRVRTQMERSYVEHDSKMQLQMARKQRELDRTTLECEITALKEKIEEEARAHAEIQDFLKRATDSLTQKLEEWNAKFENDTEAKTQELEDLKAKRAADLSRLQELSDQFKEYEKVCLQDRKRKRKMREAAERAIKELAAAIRIQSWWRGQLVRNKGGAKPKAKKSAKKKAGGKKKKKK